VKVNMTVEVTDAQRRILHAALEDKRGLASRDMVRDYVNCLLWAACEELADALDELPPRKTWKKREAGHDNDV